MQAHEVATAVLTGPDYGTRVRQLRARKPAFSPALVDEFVRAARASMRSDPAQARQLARLALYVARALKDVDGRLRCLRTLTQAATLAGHYPEALRAVDEALAAMRPHGDPHAIAELRALRVQALTQLDRYAEARETAHQALRVFERTDDAKGIARTHMALAELAIHVKRPREALRHYAHVERVLPDPVGPRLRAALCANRANALLACHRFRAATRWFERAREGFLEAGCDHTVAQMDYNLAYALVLRGRFDDALRRYDAVEAAFVRLDDDMHLAHIDLDRAEIHLLLNLPDDARGYAERAAQRFEALGLENDLAQAEHFAGRAAALAGELQTARDRYASERARLARLGLVAPQIRCLVQEAYVAQRMDRRHEARSLAAQAAALVDEDTDALTAAKVDLLQANLHLAAGRVQAALGRADAVLARCRPVHDPQLHVEAQRVIGAAHRARGNDQRALLAYRAAIDVLERHRDGVPPDEYMTAFLGASAAIYAETIDLLAARGDVELAFEYVERARSRSLLDLLARPRTPRPGSQAASGRVRFLREALNAAYWHLFRGGAGGGPTEDGFSQTHRRVAALEEELGRLLREDRRVAGGGSASATAPRLHEIQGLLGPDATLVEYFVAGDRLLVFAVTSTDAHLVGQTLEPDEIEGHVRRFRFHLAKHERPVVHAASLTLAATRDNLERLRQRILDPVAPHLHGTRLVVSPHGPLHGLPFHALPWGEGWLCDRFEVLHVPSAGVFRQCARTRERARGRPAVLGLPDAHAPQIEAEARHVAQVLHTPHLLLGEQATLANLRAAAVTARLIHIATHGVFRPATPELSAVRLADGWATLHDLDTLDVRGELIVLSTCESGTAGVSAGNEILGLTRGFFQAGVPALLCSQWRVRDDDARRFMAAFYAAWTAGRDPAAAQRHAMAVVRRARPHPYAWAPFFLLGVPVPASRHDSPGGEPPTAGALPPTEGIER